MSTDKKTIFLVDDDLTNLTIGSNALAGHYNVVTLNSGTRLLKSLEKKTPDLILLDVDMPDMSGYETIKLLKSNSAFESIPVVFLTAKNDSENEIEGLSLGAIDYIIKPFSPPLLLKRIEVHLLVESQTKELLAQKRELVNFNNNLQQMVETKTEAVLELQNAVLKAMAELVECRDDITGGHIERTQNYLRILIDELFKSGLHCDEVSSWDIDLVLQSAQLHDVGKIAIEDSILRKPGRLTAEEYEKIKVHTTFGGQVISKIRTSTSQQEFLEIAQTLAFTHHEKWDGSGYPSNLAGEDIPLLGRLMAIADVYDALVSDRLYKTAFPHDQAVEIIKNDSGSHFDPDLVEVFIGVADEFNNVAVQYKPIVQ